MALTNKERIGRGLEQLREGLVPFVESRLQEHFKADWKQRLGDSRSQRVRPDGTVEWDTYRVLRALEEYWKLLFDRPPLGRAERNYVGELLDWRNRHAHDGVFTSDDVYRCLDTAQRLLQAAGATAQSLAVGELKAENQRTVDSDRARNRTRYQPTLEGTTPAGLKPWREVVTPHKDVATGNYMQAEFAADLAQVHKGEATAEYQEPVEFFRRTYLTDGLRDLLEGALLRLADKGGDPVIELQTNFGGGKTHSMLALYHLFSGVESARLDGMEPMLKRAGVSQAAKANRAVLVGTALSPGQVVVKDDGTEVRTLWGELAWQLGGKKAFALVAESDARGISPGSDVLSKVLQQTAPCLVMIDEWVAYARNIIDKVDCPAGTFDGQSTFAQALTEAVKSAPRAMVIASIPSSDIEIGGPNGKMALDVLKNVFERVAKPWRPASGDEGFEIVRRRLFEPIQPDAVPDRDAAIDQFIRLYRNNQTSFPAECNDPDYRDRMVRSYPIHPELFRRLYDDWSTLDRFQRTRGVLRLLAKVVHRLWVDDDRTLLILPASVPMDDGSVKSELTRYLHDQWEPIISQDIDGPDSRPYALDKQVSTLGRYSAARRVARTLYVGTAPGSDSNQPGIGAERVLLGASQPGETLGTFSDALRRLSDEGQNIHQDGNRYWVSSKPNLNRTAEGKASAFMREGDRIEVEIIRRLREDRVRGDFAAVHVCPESTGEVPDEPRARLVVLGPEKSHKKANQESSAMKAAREFLDSRGNSPRVCRNALVFLAADEKALVDLRQGVAHYLAWKEIHDGWEALNLDAFQKNQASAKQAEFDKTTDLRIGQTWVHALCPTQPKISDPVGWEEVKVSGDDPLAKRTADRLAKEELLIRAMSPVRLRMELDRVPLWRGNHVPVKQLVDDWSRYGYLPRVKDASVLVNAIREGVALVTWAKDSFALADGYDEAGERYLAIRAGQQLLTLDPDGPGLLVKPEVARQQLDVEEHEAEAERARRAGGGAGDKPTPGGGTGGGHYTEPAPEPQIRRFHGRVTVNPLRAGADAGKIAEEVISHLAGLMKAKVSVTLEIEAELPDGASDQVVRTVTENCRTLKFDSQGFERE
ncbi:MAG: Swt1 family HEPN domain-containing protein [Vicinamibacterales bacterium]